MSRQIRSAIIRGTILYAFGAWIYISSGETTLGGSLPFLPLAIVGVFVFGLVQKLKQKAFLAGQRDVSTLLGHGERRKDAIQRD